MTTIYHKHNAYKRKRIKKLHKIKFKIEYIFLFISLLLDFVRYKYIIEIPQNATIMTTLV